MQPMNTGTPEDPVSRIVFREVPKTVRTAFLLFLASTILAVIATNSFVLLGSPISSLSIFFEAMSFILAVYAGVLYLLARQKLSRWLGSQFYLLAILGLFQGGIFYAIAAYQLLSAGYWLRQASTGNGCRCVRDGENVVALGDAFPACPKCSRRASIGNDIPKRWYKTAVAAFIVGLAFLPLWILYPTLLGNVLVWYAGSRLLYDGGIFTFSKFALASYSGYVRFPPKTPSTDGESLLGNRN